LKLGEGIRDAASTGTVDLIVPIHALEVGDQLMLDYRVDLAGNGKVVLIRDELEGLVC
jgi:hypothetical protein